MFTPYLRPPGPLLQIPPRSSIPAFAAFGPLLAIAVLIGPAPVQDPRPVTVPGPGCPARLAEAEATLVALEGHNVESIDAP